MPTLHYPLYDTVPLGTVADKTHTLFQVGRGQDATHTKQYTNMRGSGALPQNEGFVLRSIYATVWDIALLADLEELWDGNYVEVYVSDELMLQVPLVMCAWRNGYQGVVELAAVADHTFVGRNGDGFKLDPNIEIDGGDQFRVEVFQDNAVSVALNMWIILDGLLTRE